MRSEEFLTTWIEQKRNMTDEMNFAHGVMQRVEEYERHRRRRWADRIGIPPWVWTHPLARAGWIATASVVGLVRGIFLFQAALGG